MSVLKRGRDARQPLDLDLPERKILLEARRHGRARHRARAPRRAQADRGVHDPGQCRGGRDAGARRQPLIYRVHDEPSLEKHANRCASSCATLGIVARQAAARCGPRSSTACWRRFAGTDNERLVNEVVLRSQSAGRSIRRRTIGHFGLNLRRYAHFTSPIRRYADLIVHRALIARARPRRGRPAASRARSGWRRSATQISDDRAPRHGGRARDRRPADRAISSPTGSARPSTARISGVTKSGLFVQLPQYGADGFIPISTLGDDYYHFDEAAHALFGERSGKGFQLADHVEVKLVEVAPLAGAMRFEMLTEPKPMPGSKKSFHKSKGRTSRGRGPPSRAVAAGDRHGYPGFWRRESYRPPCPRRLERDVERLSLQMPEMRRGKAVFLASSALSRPAPIAARKCTITAPTTCRPIW